MIPPIISDLTSDISSGEVCLQKAGSVVRISVAPTDQQTTH